MRRSISAASVLLLLLVGLSPVSAGAEARTRVFLNGVPTAVHFNDGDSFRVLGGKYAGTTARLQGYNTLETYGPVHLFGPWKASELYVLSKMATLNARRGVWNCTGDGRRDGYGRVLWDCRDLAIDQIRKGLAHALSINAEPADLELLAAQHQAQAERKGMWAHGIPDFVVTSLHSLAEDPTREKHYNRTVSSLDGHSADWTHRDTYAECQKVCYVHERLRPEVGIALAAELKADPELASGLSGFAPNTLALVINQYVRDGKLTPILDHAVRGRLAERLAEWKTAGRLAAVEEASDSCHVYVDFKRRFGLTRAACLAKKY